MIEPNKITYDDVKNAPIGSRSEMYKKYIEWIESRRHITLKEIKKEFEKLK